MNVTTHAKTADDFSVEVDGGVVYLQTSDAAILISMTPNKAQALRDKLTAALAAKQERAAA